MSIRLRLVAWYGVLFAIVLVVVALLSYAFHARSHYDDFDRTLVLNAGHAIAQVTPTGDARELIAGSGGFDVVLRLYNADGTLEDAASDAAQLPLINPQTVLTGGSPPAFDPIAGLVPPLVAPPAAARNGAFGLLSAGGQRWRTYVQPLVGADGATGYIEALMPLGDMDRLIQAYRVILLGIGIVGLAIAIIGSGLVARQALRPIARMVETAQIITGSRDFSRRIAAPPQRDELGHLAGTFNGMLGSLEAAYRAQQQFVADASHELRAPLTAIQGNLELIRRHPAMSAAERTEALGEAEREASRLSRLVADLLALARADAGVEVKRRTVDLDTVVLDAFQTARQLAHGQTLVLHPFEPAQVIGDADRLKQLFLTLLDNAIKYTAPDGQVTFGLDHTAQHVNVRVADTGVGIGAADLPRVFERFYRADPARGRDPGGTGLGLSIAKWIVDQHDGTIAIESEPGQGTVVTVRLPHGDQVTSGTGGQPAHPVRQRGRAEAEQAEPTTEPPEHTVDSSARGRAG